MTANTTPVRMAGNVSTKLAGTNAFVLLAILEDIVRLVFYVLISEFIYHKSKSHSFYSVLLKISSYVKVEQSYLFLYN